MIRTCHNRWGEASDGRKIDFDFFIVYLKGMPHGYATRFVHKLQINYEKIYLRTFSCGTRIVPGDAPLIYPLGTVPENP